jgi:hypothetical protein
VKNARVRSLHTAGLIAVSVAVISCGAPNLSAMHPQVKKPTAAVLLIDEPASWSVSSVQGMMTQDGVVANVQNVKSSQVGSALHSLLGNPSVGLIVCVQDGPIPQSEFDVAKQNIGQRFELVGTEATSGTAMNVKQVVPDAMATSYSLGWLTGQLSITWAVQTVGWIADSASVSTPEQVKAALIGAYSANSAFQVTLLNMANLDPTLPVPKLAVATRPLSDQEMQAFNVAGTRVVSLCSQPTGAIAAKPILPDETVIQPDVDALVTLNWQAGNVSSTHPPLVWNNPSIVPADLTTNVLNIETGLNTPFNVQTSWQRIPPTIRQLWMGVPGASNP